MVEIDDSEDGGGSGSDSELDTSGSDIESGVPCCIFWACISCLSKHRAARRTGAAPLVHPAASSRSGRAAAAAAAQPPSQPRAASPADCCLPLQQTSADMEHEDEEDEEDEELAAAEEAALEQDEEDEEAGLDLVDGAAAEVRQRWSRGRDGGACRSGAAAGGGTEVEGCQWRCLCM